MSVPTAISLALGGVLIVTLLGLLIIQQVRATAVIESWPDRLHAVTQEAPPDYWTATAVAQGALDGEVFGFGAEGSEGAYAAPWPGTLEWVNAVLRDENASTGPDVTTDLVIGFRFYHPPYPASGTPNTETASVVTFPATLSSSQSRHVARSAVGQSIPAGALVVPYVSSGSISSAAMELTIGFSRTEE